MKQDKKPITKLWKKAKQLSDDKNVEEAIPLLERILIIAAEASLKGVKEIEGIKVDLIKDRCWLHIENLVGLPEYE